jgi:hypothetical protein
MSSGWGGFRMATVRCDVCNGIFSQSYLASHKRLAHAKKGASAPAPAPITEKEVMQKIASLYESLSVKGQKHIIRLLSAKEQKILNEQ